MEAVAKHGALRGSALAAWRLLRCQPFCEGGYDPVPDAPNKACSNKQGKDHEANSSEIR